MISTQKKKSTISYAICLLLGITFVFQTTLASKPFLEKTNPEYFLRGTLEETADFNFNINAGEQLVNQITIVNNSPTAISYNLDGVDSSINNQQVIVFNSQSAENPNLGKWLTFEKRQITVEPDTSLTIPFTIAIPTDAFPGTYFGGISIQKIPATAPTTSDSGSSMSVRSLTRQVLGLTINIAGTLDKSYNISPLEYDKVRKVYLYTIENTGNVLMSFKGSLNITSNNLWDSTGKSIDISNFKILPHKSVTKTIAFQEFPLFGTTNASVNGQLEYFNGLKNSYESLETVTLTNETTSFSWPILGIVIGLIFFLLILIIYLTIKEKRYLQHCVMYTVKQDETIEGIAKDHNMDWKKLAKINKLTAPYTIKPSQKILVHESSKVK